MAWQRTPLRVVFLVFVTGMAGLGCGGDTGPARFQLSGKVTFAGQPVKFGSIQFDPDKGNEGPQGFAEIRDGVFDTAKGGQGAVRGKIVAKINGYESAPVSANSEEPIPALFVNYEVHFEMQDKATAKDFDVPKLASDNKVDPGAGP